MNSLENDTVREYPRSRLGIDILLAFLSLFGTLTTLK